MGDEPYNSFYNIKYYSNLNNDDFDQPKEIYENVLFSQDQFVYNNPIEFLSNKISSDPELQSLFLHRSLTDIKNINYILNSSDKSKFNNSFPPKYGYQITLNTSKDTDKKIHDSYYLPNKDPNIDTFIQKQTEFLNNLTHRESTAITAYTFHGDRLINSFLRGTLRDDITDLIGSIIQNDSVPFKYAIYDKFDWLKLNKKLYMPLTKDDLIDAEGKVYDETINKILIRNVDWFSKSKNIGPLIVILLADITKVILSAPRPKHDFIVYRGIRRDRTPSLTVKTNDFWSTSINPYSSIRFTHYIDKDIYSAVYEITVRAGMPCLYLQPYSFISKEYEILLPPGITYTMDKTIFIKKQLQYQLDHNVGIDGYISHANPHYMMPKRRILVIPATAKGFDSRLLSLRDIVDGWKKQKERPAELLRRKFLKQGMKSRKIKARASERNPNRNKNKRLTMRRKEDREEKVVVSENNINTVEEED